MADLTIGGLNNYKVIRMIYEIFENEVVMLLLGVGVLTFILGNRARLKQLTASKILIVAFYLLLAGWVLTVLEGFFWEGILNFVEHLCTAVSSVLVAAWCWKVFGSRPRDSASRRPQADLGRKEAL